MLVGTPIAFDRGTFKLGSDKVEYSPLICNFFIDDNYDSYVEAFNWIHKMASPELKVADINMVYTDVTVFMLNNSLNSSRKMVFHYAFPTVLGSVEFTNENEGMSLKSSLTMLYSSVEITPSNNDLTGFFGDRHTYRTDIPQSNSPFD